MANKRVIILWAGGEWEFTNIETDTLMDDDKPDTIKITYDNKKSKFILAGKCKNNWLYIQE